MKKSLLIIGVMVALTTVAFGYGTIAGALISNVAIVSGANITTGVFTITNTNRGITGAYGAGVPDVAAALAGTTVVFTNTVTNYGNFTTTLTLFMECKEVTAGTAGTWPYLTYWTTDGGVAGSNTASIDTGALAPGNTAVRYFHVEIPPDAMNNTTRYTLVVKAGDSSNTLAVQYTGDNGLTYGSRLGVDSASNNQSWIKEGVTSDNYWEVTVAAAALTITKTAFISNVTTPGWGSGQTGTAGVQVVPGSIITYRIFFDVSGVANGVVIKDVLPANTTLGEVRYDGTGATAGSYGGTVQNPAVNADNYELSGSELRFYPGTGTDGGAGSVSVDGYIYYQVTVD